MKHTFTITWEEDERESADIYIDAPKLHSAVWDFSQWLRTKVKHEELSEEQLEALEEARTKLYEFLNEEGIEL